MVIVATERMSEEAYREFALGDTHGRWELADGQLWEKPEVTAAHDWAAMNLVRPLLLQLDPGQHRISIDHARLRVSAGTYFIPDVVVIPTRLILPLLDDPKGLNAHAEPLPLVVEVRSPSTGRRDLRVKLAGYQRRGDLEIWFIHPIERTVTTWVRQPDGSYLETVYREGTIQLTALPGAAIEVRALFAA
jgi:Uma2 family endonuclease